MGPTAGSFHGLQDELDHEGKDGVGDELQDEGAEELHKEHGGWAAHPDGVLLNFQNLIQPKKKT